MYTYEELSEKIKMPDDACREIYEYLDFFKNDEEFKSIKEIFYTGEDVEGLLFELAKKKGKRPLLTVLAFCYFCADRMYEIFTDKGFGDKVYIDSFTDVRVWALTCKNNYGEWGMKEFCWLQKTLRGELYRLGRLQFEFFPFPYEHYENHGVVINKGDTVINTHIPEDGGFPRAERLESYRQAYEKLGRLPFVCESYLLYPAQYEFLNPDSNIVDFMNEYEIIHCEENDKMNDMWRIFGVRESYEASTLPRNTSLRRAYADHIEKTGKNGWGFGVLIFDGEKILTRKCL